MISALSVEEGDVVDRGLDAQHICRVFTAHELLTESLGDMRCRLDCVWCGGEDGDQQCKG